MDSRKVSAIRRNRSRLLQVKFKCFHMHGNVLSGLPVSIVHMDADITTIAALIGDPTRTNMLLALMGGLAFPAGELAMRANVAPQTASSHLSKLLDAKLLSVEVKGRQRYYRLAGPEIASVIESLMTAAHRPTSPIRCGFERGSPLRFARTCYDHLAGRVAVEIFEAFQQLGLLISERDNQYRATEEGRLWFEKFGINLDEIKFRRRGFARQCLDWTERRYHLAGALGSAFLQRLFELRRIVRTDKTRAVRVTHNGREQLGKLLGVKFTA
jgi:DNA-binding transcriptional ArsR family regulator